MKITNIYMSQRKLRNPEQLSSMMEADCLPPIVLAEFEDGTIQLEDGHHRCVAYWLMGRTELEKGEYILIQKDSNFRPRFGKIYDLLKRI